jgi:DNA-binding MarR family transcriptional regulator
MVERGMIIRRADQHDGRRVFVELSPEMSKALREYFVNVIRSHGQDAKNRQAAA